jgi:hypothetical protein
MISTWLFWTLTSQNKTKGLLSLITVIVISLTPSLTCAQEPLSFRDAKSYKERKALSFTQKEQQAPDIKHVLSAVDLNGDSLDEYITRPQSCTAKDLCNYHVIAFMQDNPITLLTVKARKIIIEDTHKYGIRNLLIFNSKMNDFQKSRYTWNPYTYIYEQKD